MTRSPDSAPHAVTQQCSSTTPVSDAHSLKPLGKEHEFAMQCRRRSCKYFCTDQSSSSALVLFAVERKWNSSCLSVQAKLQNQGLLITEPQRFPRAYTHKKRWPPTPRYKLTPRSLNLCAEITICFQVQFYFITQSWKMQITCSHVYELNSHVMPPILPQVSKSQLLLKNQLSCSD